MKQTPSTEGPRRETSKPLKPPANLVCLNVSLIFANLRHKRWCQIVPLICVHRIRGAVESVFAGSLMNSLRGRFLVLGTDPSLHFVHWLEKARYIARMANTDMVWLELLVASFLGVPEMHP